MCNHPLTAADFRTLAEAILRRGVLRFQASGSSMHPLIQDGDILRVRSGTTPKLGEVVLCTASCDRLLAHRVVRVRRPARGTAPSYLIQGDNLAQPDGWLSRDAILGSIHEIQRQERVIHAQTPLWRMTGLLWHLLRSARRKGQRLCVRFNKA